MKWFSVMRLAAVVAAASSYGAARADAAEPTTPTGFAFYGNGDGTFDTANPGYPGGMAEYVPGTPAHGAGPATYATGYGGAGYAGYGYGGAAGYGYAGAAYAGYGYGGDCAGACNTCRPHRRHRRCCTFGGNCACCDNCWDGYCAGDPGYDSGCCAGPVKVHRRHRALGCGAGPCVDAAACGACAPRRHHCHLRRRCAAGCDNCNSCGAAGPSYIPSGMYDGSNGPTMAAPGAPEQLNPSLNEEPRPMLDGPST
ncbi:MAG TPA: hypothetical protein VHC22_10835 [Pirellulales bacterium]|nr:hypothetical protein [Pirellulales bacterium]